MRQWRTKDRFSTDEIAETRTAAIDAIDEYLESSRTLLTQQTRRLQQLERKKQKLIHAYLDDTLPAEDIRARQLEIQREIADAHGLLRSTADDRLLLLCRGSVPGRSGPHSTRRNGRDDGSTGTDQE